MARLTLDRDVRQRVEFSVAPQAASPSVLLLISWLVVKLPLAWGIIETLKKSLVLFH